MIGAMAAMAIGAAVGGGLQAKGASKQAKAQKKVARAQTDAQYAIAEEAAAERERISEKVGAEGELARKHLRAAEEAQVNVYSSLGAPGTYDMPGDYSKGPVGLKYLSPTGLDPLRTGGILSSGEEFRKEGIIKPEDVAMRGRERMGKDSPTAATWQGPGKKWKVEGKVLDPDIMAAQIKSTSGFRQVSRLVAESEQLLNRRGRLWEEMNNSIVGGIYESSAAFHRQAMEELSRDVARGGSARSRAMATAQKFQIQEGINRQRTGALWQSKLGMEQWIRANAAQVQNFAMAWTQNHSGIRDSFTANLTNLTTFWTQTMAPALIGASVSSQTATQRGVLAAQAMYNEAAKTKTAMYAAIAAGVKGVAGAAASAMSGGAAGAGGGSSSGIMSAAGGTVSAVGGSQ